MTQGETELSLAVGPQRRASTSAGSLSFSASFPVRLVTLLTKSDIADEVPKVHKLVADGLCDVYVLMTNAGVSGKQEAQIRSVLIGAGVKHVLIYATWIEDQIKEKHATSNARALCTAWET